MKRLSGVDAMMVYSETPNVHMHTLKMLVVDASDFDGAFDFDLFSRTIRGRIHLLEPLLYQLVEVPLGLHHPMWLDNAEIDWDYHLRRAQAPVPGGRREFDQIIGEIASTPLDRDRPLWELHFVEGLADNRYVIVIKIHHALADGVASANLMELIMDRPGSVADAAAEEVEKSSAPYWSPSTGDLLRAAGRDHLAQIRALPQLVAETARGVSRVRRAKQERVEHPDMARPFQAPSTFMNHVLPSGRTYATATLAFAEVKETSKHLGVTINDVVLTTAAGALRQLALRYDGRADAPLVASVPTSTGTSAGRLTGNEVSSLYVSLPVHVADPAERLQLVRLATQMSKESQALLGPTLIATWMGYLPPFLVPALFRRVSQREAKSNSLNIVVSNVPGPRERGRFAGATVSELYSVGPLMAGSGLTITVWSYVDQLNISVISDNRTVKDPHEVTAAMIDAFAEIRRTAGLSDTLAEVATAMAQVSR